MNIVVTGVGAVIGLGIIKSLRLCPEAVTIIGVDRNANAFGRRRCDHFVQKPAGEEGSEYLSYWHRLIETHAVDMVIPGIEPDVFFFDAHRPEFDSNPAKIVLNSAELIRLGKDKWATVERLRAAGIDAIPTRISGSWEECAAELGPAPLLMKPRHGSGGIGMALLQDKTDFDYWRAKAPENFMVQRVVGSDDQEYTVSVFGYGDGRATRAAILRRTLGPVGATWWAETVASCPPIEQMTQTLTRLLQPEGPTNYQFRLEGDKAFLLEINPRISASTSLRAHLGVNESRMCIEHYLLHRELGAASLRPGQAWRFIEDEVDIQ